MSARGRRGFTSLGVVVHQESTLWRFFFHHASIADIRSKQKKQMLGHQGVGRNKVSDSTLACCCKDTFILEAVSMVISVILSCG